MVTYEVASDTGIGIGIGIGIRHSFGIAITCMAYGQQTSFILIIHLECCGSLQGGQCAFSIPLGLADVAKGIFPLCQNWYSDMY
jgi:hypothetical protein